MLKVWLGLYQGYACVVAGVVVVVAAAAAAVVAVCQNGEQGQ